MNKSVIAVIGSGVVLIAVTIILIIYYYMGSESYREVKIYKVNGEADVERTGNISIDAFENMQLQDQDHVNVHSDSYTELKMDEDKYALLEPDTRIGIEATGNAADSRTTINLEYGAIVSDLEHKLSERSSYEVNTSNSTMAVRGTSFRIYTYHGNDNDSYTILEVIGGVVEVCLVYPDGSVSDGRMIYAGQKIMIRGDSKTSEYVYDDGRVELNEYSVRVLDFLKVHFDEEYYCSEEDINMAIAQKDNENDENDASEEATPAVVSGDKDNKDDIDENCTVIFSYNGQMFASQKVHKGLTIKEPSLKPTPYGRWDFDFNSRIDSDVTINWIE